MTRTWPEDWEQRKQGVGCPFCADLTGRSFHSGRISEALLHGSGRLRVPTQEDVSEALKRPIGVLG